MRASRGLVVGIVFAAGCATGTALGGQTMVAPHHGASVEATAAAGIGLGGESSSFTLRGQATLGVGDDGIPEFRYLAGYDAISLGAKQAGIAPSGWQVAFLTGGSLGSYQSPDLTFQLTGGPHWNLERTLHNSDLSVTSIALDFTIGDAIALPKDNVHQDGVFVGLGVSLRHDKVTGLDWKPVH